MATLRPTHRLHRQTQLIALLGLVAALLSAPVTAAAQPPPARLAGPDRYATAAAVVEATFDQATTVYVATGEGFADALAGGPRAALDGAPILLVQREAIPAPTATELARLQPQRIVILGGPGAVSDAVRQQLQATGAQVQRLAGASRFATAAAISRDGFSPGVGIAYLATGDTFPDALAGGAAGGLTGGPVLLLSGTTIPAETAAELARLQPQTVALLGGPAAIPDTIVLELGQHTDAPVRRLAGADRVATAVAVSQDTHHDGLTVDTVFLATAGNFPDALAGAPAVAADRGALLLTGAECIPLAVRDEIARLAHLTASWSWAVSARSATPPRPSRPARNCPPRRPSPSTPNPPPGSWSPSATRAPARSRP